jgi:hypothetical protein
MSTKAAQVEHRCMVKLFEGIDVPGDDIKYALKARLIKTKGPGRKVVTEEELRHEN